MSERPDIPQAKNDEQPIKRKKKRKNIALIFINILASFTAILSLYMIASTLIIGKQEQNAFDELTAIVEQEKEKTDFSESEQQVPEQEKTESTEPTVLPEYAELYEKNGDFFGWIKIDNTPINYPVMHTPEDPQYYLRRAFDKSSSQSGTVFMDGACFEGCGNYIIYGHHMKNETMFGTLPNYAEKDYWEEHRIISFDTVYEHGEYEVIAAFFGVVLAEDEPGFRYYRYKDLTDPEIFEEYMDQLKTVAVYDTGITAEYGDELITLSTCSYHTTDGRFVVVAKKINS